MFCKKALSLGIKLYRNQKKNNGRFRQSIYTHYMAIESIILTCLGKYGTCFRYDQVAGVRRRLVRANFLKAL